MVRIEVLTDTPEDRFARGKVLHREGSDEPLTIEWSAPVQDGPGWRLRFRELRDRTAADGLRDAYLEAEAPGDALSRGEYWWHEVLGVPVTDVSGRQLGTVADVYRAGGAEVFVVRGGSIGEFDVPAVRAFIRIFAPRRGEIVVDAEALELDLPPGVTPPLPAAEAEHPGPDEPSA